MGFIKARDIAKELDEYDFQDDAEGELSSLINKIAAARIEFLFSGAPEGLNNTLELRAFYKDKNSGNSKWLVTSEMLDINFRSYGKSSRISLEKLLNFCVDNEPLFHLRSLRKILEKTIHRIDSKIKK